MNFISNKSWHPPPLTIHNGTVLPHNKLSLVVTTKSFPYLRLTHNLYSGGRHAVYLARELTKRDAQANARSSWGRATSTVLYSLALTSRIFVKLFVPASIECIFRTSSKLNSHSEIYPLNPTWRLHSSEALALLGHCSIRPIARSSITLSTQNAYV